MSTALENKFKNETFIFSGTTKEYFKIWLVNIVLTILTLGIYSAWAKVRKKRYFYGNTRLAGGHFTYLAQPMQILKGRIIAVFVLVLAGAVIQLYPLAEPILSFGFLLILPLLFVSTLRFNAQNSAYQHIRFQYKATYLQALGVFLLYGLLMIITLGIAYPFFARARQNLLIAKHQYGQLHFQFEATSGQFYNAYIKANFLFLFIIALYAGSFFLVSQYFSDSEFFSTEHFNLEKILAHNPELAEEIGSHCTPDVDCDEASLEAEQMMAAAIAQSIGFLVGIYAILFFIYVHISVRITNLSLNHSRIGAHQLKAELETLPLFFIYLSNIIGILLSLGLLIPWAQIRLARYRLSCISLNVLGNLDEVIAQAQAQGNAIGEEFGDFMDVDIGL